MRESKRVRGYGHEDWAQFAMDDGSKTGRYTGPESVPLGTAQALHEHSHAFRRMWFSPRETTAELMNRNRRGYIYPLAMLGGVAYVLSHAYAMGTPELPTLLLIPVMVVQACFLGLIWLYVFARLLALTGGWFGGRAAAKDLEVPVGWSRLPEIITTPALAALFAISFFGSRGFFSAWAPWLLQSLQWSLVVVAALATLWGLVILVAGITVVQKFSIWRALASSLLATIFGVILLLCIVVPVFFAQSAT